VVDSVVVVSRTVVEVDVVTVSVAVVVLIVEVVHPVSRVYASKAVLLEVPGDSTNQRQISLSARYVKNVQKRSAEHSSAHPATSSLPLMVPSVPLCRRSACFSYPSSPVGQVLPVAVAVLVVVVVTLVAVIVVVVALVAVIVVVIVVCVMLVAVAVDVVVFGTEVSAQHRMLADSTESAVHTIFAGSSSKAREGDTMCDDTLVSPVHSAPDHTCCKSRLQPVP
jgi:hypothetical protein